MSTGEFARFVEAGGYDSAKYWPADAGVWRAQSACAHPQHWRRGTHGDGKCAGFDHWLRLVSTAPAMHPKCL